MTALTRRPRNFPAGLELHADQLNANLEVQVAPGLITAYATGEGAESIRAERRGDTLRISGGPARSFTAGGVTVVGSGVVITSGSISGQNVTIDSRGVTVDGVRVTPGTYGQPEPPTVHVTVPEGTPVTLTGVTGDTTIGDLRGIRVGHVEGGAW